MPIGIQALQKLRLQPLLAITSGSLMDFFCKASHSTVPKGKTYQIIIRLTHSLFFSLPQQQQLMKILQPR